MWSSFPSISEWLEDPRVKGYQASLSASVVRNVVRCEVNLYKSEMESSFGKDFSLSREELRERLWPRLEATLRSYQKKRLQRVVNATGVVLHTNLGRSPLREEVWRRARDLNTRYVNLEISLKDGKRGARGAFIRDLLLSSLHLDESYDALILNNNAATIFLYLSTLPKGSEVVVSRGELVQIGGGFRIPEIMESAGVQLKEVGTTNRTTKKDYEKALGSNTAAIFKVHPSNFTQTGFVSSVSLSELAQICSPSLPLIWDQGSGNLWVDRFGEENLRHSFSQGAHLALCSGDKLLGGPQAGLAIGKKNIIAAMKNHPLYRTFRASRVILSLLQQHLLLEIENPQWGEAKKQDFRGEMEKWKQKAQTLQREFPDLLELVWTRSPLGGGSAPGYSRESVGLVVMRDDASFLQKFFRDFSTPIISSVEKGRVILDFSTLLEGDDAILREALLALQGQDFGGEECHS